MLTSSRLRTGAVLLAIGAIAACSSGASPGSSTTQPPNAGATTVVITGFAYSVPASVRPGHRLTIRNEDDVAHTVTSTTAHLFDVPVAGSGRATLTAPTTPGRYAFVCSYHPYMHATLVVRP